MTDNKRNKFKPGDLVITNNFTLMQDLCKVQKDGTLKVIGRYPTDKIFNVIENFIKSERMMNNGNNVYVKEFSRIPKNFNFKSIIKTY